MNYSYIKTKKDIECFLEKTNSLHDGYIIGVEYINDGITNLGQSQYSFDYRKKRLLLRILVTSIWDAIVEIEFAGMSEWQIKENEMDMTNTSIILDGNNIVWLDDVFINMDEIKNGSYVIADSMKWRIIE